MSIHCFSSNNLKDDTLENQNKILNKALKNGKNWILYNTAHKEDYEICGAYSANRKSAIVVFERMNDGTSKLILSSVENSDNIIISGIFINKQWHDLVWFNGAKTEYAKIIYNIPNEEEKTIKFNTS